MLRLVLIFVLTYPSITYSSTSLMISDDGASVTLVKSETNQIRKINFPINTTSGQFANITVDGNISDWTNIPVLITDPVGDSTDIDIKTLKVANDENFIYFLEEFANPLNNYTSLQLDTDLNSATGCTATAGMGIEYGIAINAETAFIGDARDCSWGIEDFPNAFVTVVSGNFVEASVPINVLQDISPEFTGFDISVSNDTEIARYMLASNDDTPPPPSSGDCPHATFSVADKKITIPMLDMPLLDSLTGEPNGNMAVLKADLQMTEGVGDFKMIPESISVLSDVEPNNECHASFSYETRIMHLPFVDVSSTIMLPPNIVIDGPIQVFEANLQQLQLYNEIYHLKDYNFLYNLEGE